MSMKVENSKIIIDIPNTEAVADVQMKNSNKYREVGGFYTNDNAIEKQIIVEFFDDFKMNFYVDSHKLVVYDQAIKNKIYPYREMFKSNLSSFESDISEFLKHDKMIPKMFFGSSERYLKFDNEDVLVKKFRRLLVGKITNLVIEKRGDNFYIYPELKTNYFRSLYSLDKEKLVVSLAKILDGYYENAENKKTGIHLFGYDYCFEISNSAISTKDIVNASGTLHNIESSSEEINIGVRLGMTLKVDDFASKISESTPEREEGGYNKIFYGIPGCGKSYRVNEYIKTKLQSMEKYNTNVFRTTFYLDYSNADFVGQLVPKTDKEGNVTYVPSFGPFTSALKRAYETNDMVYLVIEEINRGNAAAIFGDLFQLLDRINERNVSNYPNSKIGDSEYPITNVFLEEYLEIEKGKVIIPSNLTILATMNTSDQNVFPLDTAFKRRWKMHKVIDDYNNSVYRDHYIPQKYKSEMLTWKEFLSSVNKFITMSDEGINQEDKQIGSYFITNDILTDDTDLVDNDDRIEQFNYKVLEYIWSDVAKFERSRWINVDTIGDNQPKSFDDLVELINKYGIKKTLNAFNDFGE